MQLALGVVTVLALLMTIGMGVVTWRLVQEERRRSAARLASLADQLEAEDDLPLESPGIGTSPRPDGPRDDLFGPRIDIGDGRTRRLAGIGIAALALAAVISAGTLVLPRPPQVEVAHEHNADSVPVELLTLDHAHADGMLAISGTVRNPDNGPTERRLTVLALVFDSDGEMVASGRAPLETNALPPGGESGFAVSIPAGDASRYRISFLLDDITVPHRDRRAAVASPSSES